MGYLLPLTNQFESFVSGNRLAHAYLIDCVPQALMSQVCDEVSKVISTADPDLHVISPSSDSASIKVDQIRDISDRLSRKPYQDRHVVCLYPAESMNTAAANALLKVLEEPPGACCFLLLSMRSGQLLPTIRSRVLSLRCPVPKIEDFSDYPDYETLYPLYKDNPIALAGTEEPLVKSLFTDVYQSNNPLLAIQDLKYASLSSLINASSQLCSVLLRENNKVHECWHHYENLIELSKIYHKSRNLNEKAIVDQLGILFSKLKES